MRIAIRGALERIYAQVPPNAVRSTPDAEMIEEETDRVLELVKHHGEY